MMLNSRLMFSDSCTNLCLVASALRTVVQDVLWQTFAYITVFSERDKSWKRHIHKLKKQNFKRKSTSPNQTSNRMRDKFNFLFLTHCTCLGVTAKFYIIALLLIDMICRVFAIKFQSYSSVFCYPRTFDVRWFITVSALRPFLHF